MAAGNFHMLTARNSTTGESVTVQTSITEGKTQGVLLVGGYWPKTLRFVTQVSVGVLAIVGTALSASTDLATTPGMANGATARPSFACSRSKTVVEQLICSDPRLALADRGFAAVYRRALAGTQAAGLVADQRAWLLKRDVCRTTECVQDTYRGQLEAVFEAVNEGTGTYRRTDGQGALTMIDVPGEAAVAFQVTASYIGRSTNFGSVTGVVPVRDNRARFAANEYGRPCVLDLRRIGGSAWTISTVDDSGCSLGHNVTVTGRYVLAPLASRPSRTRSTWP